MHVQSLKSCPTLCDSMNGSLPGSSVYGILQARILEWVPCPFPGDLPDQGLKASLLCLLHCRWVIYRLSHLGSSNSY